MCHSTFRILSSIFFALLGAGAMVAQNTPDLIVLDAGIQRQVITAYSEDQIVNLQNLQKGHQYMFVIPPDVALGVCRPEISIASQTSELIRYDSVNHILRFKANSAIAQFNLHYPCSWSPDNPPRHYVSIFCADCDAKQPAPTPADLGVIEVEGADAEELIREVFIGGDCFDVTGISFSGGGDQIGKFYNGLTNVGFATGMIMATGDISVAIGPNDSNGASGGGGGGGGDGDLAAIASGPLFDVASIEFDFTPTQTPLTFEYVFASEEYCEYVNTSYNDVFGFFISGPGIIGTKNLAVVPTTTTPITINTINHVTNSGLYVHNTPAGLDNCENGGVSGTLPPVPPAQGPATQELQYDGFTRKMIAVAQVIPCSTYHMKLAVADVGDGVWDSAVFLKAGSFDGGGNASIDWIVNGDPDLDEVVEGCGTVQILVDRVGSNPALPLPVSFTITGTATSGADFSPIPVTITIPAGQDQVLFPVNIINDLIPEGAETIILTLNSPCSCLHPQEILTILDYIPMVPTPDTITICGPTGVGTVSVVVADGVEPYTYQWNAGGNESTFTAFVSSSTNFTVTVTDACGKTKTAVARINVSPVPKAQLVPPAPQLCPGQSIFLPVNFIGIGPFELNYTRNGDAMPPISGISDNPYMLEITQPGLYQISSVIDSFGCPGPGVGAVLVSPSNLTLTGTVSNATCSTLTNGSINTTVTGGIGPYSYVWHGPSTIGNIADPNNILPGTYTVTVTDGYGCTQNNNFIIQSPPPLAPSATVVNVNCFQPNGGSIDLSVTGGNPGYTYMWSNGFVTQDLSNLGVGTYTVTITDQTGCTKTNTSSITGDFTQPVANAVVNDALTCITQIVVIDGSASSTGNNFNYQWTPAGGVILGQGTLQPTVNVAGNYTLLVSNTTNGCTNTAIVNVPANNTPPTTNAGPNATLTCAIDTLTLNGGSSSTGANFLYHWTATNGGAIISGDSTLTPTVATPGTYTLLVTNTVNGCTSTDNAVVNTDFAPPTASVAPPGQITCTSPTVQLSGAGSSTGLNFSYEWTSSTGSGIGLGGNTLTPTVTAVGTYTLIVTNNTNGCSSTASATVTSNASVPTAVAAPQGVLTCSIHSIQIDASGSSTGNNFNYHWGTFDGDILAGQGTLQLTAGEPGTYTLLVTNTTNNCTASFNVLVEEDVAPPTANAGPQVTLTCALPASTLDGSGSSTGAEYSYQWTTVSGGHFVSATNILNPQVDTAGVYQLLVTNNNNGCTAISQVTVLPDANDPVALVAPPGTLNCVVSQLTLDASTSSSGPNISYNWSGPGLVSPPNALNALVDQPGSYTLIITNSSNGCSSDITVVVPQDLLPPPADAGPDQVINCFHPTQPLGGPGNPVGSNFAFNWSGTGLTGGNTASPTTSQSGTFTVLVTNTLNGCTNTDQVLVTADFVQPTASAGPGFQLTCTQNTYTLQATASTGPNFSYQWSTTTGSFTTASDILNPTVNGSGTYTLLVTNNTNGCTTNAQVAITQAADVPVAVANNAPKLTCAVTSLTLSGSGSSVGNEFNYLWTASGGGVIQSGETSLSPVITQPGTYNLQVINTVNNCTNNSSVVVEQDIVPPSIDAGATPTITCAHTTVQLSGSVNGPGNFSYQWTGGVGTITQGASTLTPTVNAGGAYLLTVTNLNNGCTSTDQATVTVDQVPPVSAILQPGTLTCDVEQLSLDASGSSSTNMAYSWTTTGGHFVNQNDPLHPLVDAPGVYTLVVLSNVNGCTSSQSVTVLQDIQHPVASAGSDGLLTCAVTSLQLNGNGSSQNGDYFYQWTTSNGLIQLGANSLTPTIIAGGTYTLSVVNNTNGCTATDQVVVSVNTQQPTVAIAPPGVITCTVAQVTLNGGGSQGGANISYAWTTSSGHIVSGATANSAVVNSAGLYTLTVLNTANGCSSQQNVSVTDDIQLPNADAGPPFTLTCTVQQVNLLGLASSGSNFSYQWSTSGGNILSGGTGLQPVVNHEGSYTLLVTNQTNGCTQTDVVEVLKETNIPTDLDYDLVLPGCKDNDGAITFTSVTGGVGPYVYSINGGQTFSSTFDFTQVTPGSYDLWIQDANGCEFHQQLNVPKAPVITVTLDPTISLELGDSITLHAKLPSNFPLNRVDTVIWEPLEGLRFLSYDITGLLNPIAKPFRTTEYNVLVTTKDGCDDAAKVLIRVDNEPHIYIPNVFSPWKEDGKNDIFLIFADGKQIVQVDKFQIYDRWGEQVFVDANFQPNDPAHGWDGRHGGKLMDPAVFVYYAEIRLIDGRVLLYKGDVTLAR